jgi:two-component system chemotaxis response regulator CheB
VIGVILSGTRGDGAIGLAMVKASGGATIVQDPAEALYAGMPATALAHVAVDAIVPSELVGDTIVAMVKGEHPPPAAKQNRVHEDHSPDDRSAVSVCPDCGGVLSERVEAGVSVWECRVGHRYSAEGFADAQATSIESALWAAIRILEDRERLLDRMASGCQSRGQPRSARSFRRRARAAKEQADLVRQALTRATELSLSRTEDDEAEQAVGNPGA